MENNNIKLTDKQKQLIQKFGVYLEKSGLAPVEARILALLLISDDIELTFDEIRETLKVSKSATSNSLNKLLAFEQIEYVTKHGDRKRYFKNNISKWQQKTEDRFNDMTSMNSILKEILESRTIKNKEFNADLKNLIDFMGFLNSELPLLFKKWKSKK